MSILVIVSIIVVIICINCKSKKEKFITPSQYKNVPVTQSYTKSNNGSTVEEKVQDMLGNNIVPNMDVKVFTDQGRILEVN